MDTLADITRTAETLGLQLYAQKLALPLTVLSIHARTNGRWRCIYTTTSPEQAGAYLAGYAEARSTPQT